MKDAFGNPIKLGMMAVHSWCGKTVYGTVAQLYPAHTARSLLCANYDRVRIDASLASSPNLKGEQKVAYASEVVVINHLVEVKLKHEHS